MYKVMDARATVFLLLHFLFLLWLSFTPCDGAERDVQCLKALKESLTDPYNSLSSWDFSNIAEGSVCNFLGVKCWGDGEDKVLMIGLSHMGLKGQFPSGLESCKSLTGLDLSLNELSGTIPSSISKSLPYVTTLDLSFNRFSGEIPTDIANCRFLNFLNLQHNQLKGQIPQQLQYLNRLKWVNVDNNSGLCGVPLDACEGPQNSIISVRLAVGVGVSVILAVVVAWFLFFLFRRVSAKEEDENEEENTKGIKLEHTARRYCNVHISTFEKTVPKMRLNNLQKATNNFSKDNIIRAGRAGTMYKAMLLDGSSLAIKRLHDSQHSEKEFISEMMMPGCLKHHNVFPLLGFCIARNERLLAYKYMPKGTLHQPLHEGHMEWPLRLRIAIGVARGLALLHHNCNPCIIHRNISSKHILLDEDYEPKISKFRSAELIDPLETNMSVHVNIRSDNIGLVAPEYTRKIVASRAGDVYSFGMVLLELITGQKPTKVVDAARGLKGILVEWIAYLEKNSHLRQAIDRSLIGKGWDDELFRFLRVAIACVVFDPEERPTMLVVYRLLQSIGPQVCIDMDGPDELYVGRQIQEIQENGLNMRRVVAKGKVRKAASF